MKRMDRQKVIEALEYLISGECTDTQMDYVEDIFETITLLKKQEAVEPKWASGIKGGADALCGSCMAWLSDHSWSYCPRCGRPVKWE